MQNENLKPTTKKLYAFTRPQYEKNCISNIPNLILNIFQAKNPKPNPLKENIKEVDCKKVNKIVLLVVDGFGYNQYLGHHKENRFLVNLANKGKVCPLTSVYPSQTTNALTTLNTGLTPQEHGLFEYFIYLKEVGTVNALRFERIGTKKRNLVEEGFDPTLMFKGKNIQQTLNQEGIHTFTHMHISNASNACTKLVFDGSTIVPALKTSDAIVNLRKNIEKNKGRAYFFVHLETLDIISHEYGPQSAEYSAELQTISHLLQKELIEKIGSESSKETLMLMTADHGAVHAEPNETTYLNLEKEPLLNMQCGRNGKRILPTGGPRDIFLHIKDQKLTRTKEALFKKIGGKAQIVETKEAIKNGLFGLGDASPEFIERAGNLLILPYGKETVWFEGPDRRKIEFVGQHGGLSEEEMLVPLGIAMLSDLKNDKATTA
ncbi:MAG: alkaline phosphatase family protein [Candidatus Bathyarchaeota archaeon]|nr:alkaline phosphatase family protein [Candidatus Bathyarchaeota archaeon]